MQTYSREMTSEFGTMNQKAGAILRKGNPLFKK